MRILTVFILFLAWCAHATTFTEFYCDTNNGSTNINAGSTTNSAAVYSSVNGNWDGTSVYTPTDGSTPASTVSAGMWGAIFIDGSTNLIQTSAGGCVMLITNVAAGVNGAITFDRSAFMGTAPSSSATGRSINVGGCWNGPYRTIGFPFGFFANTGTNGPSNFPRCNFRNTAQYNVTAAMTHNNNGPARFQGMTATAGDGGKAIMDGGTTGTSYVILTVGGGGLDFEDLVFSNNGNSSGAVGVNITGTENTLRRCVAHNIRRSGFSLGASSITIACEAYECNQANTATHGGFLASGYTGVLLVNCISHDNAGSNSDGFCLDGNGSAILLNCIAYGNGAHGFRGGITLSCSILSCSSYNNTGSGLALTGSQSAYAIGNSLFFKNGANGIGSSGSSSTLRNGMLFNCMFGSGTQTNTTGNISLASAINESQTTTYTADQTPWEDVANGNFRLSSTATTAKAAGRGEFTQLAIYSPTNTIAFPDLGAVQGASTNSTGASSGGAYTWAQ